jgi:hypothetical protein
VKKKRQLGSSARGVPGLQMTKKMQRNRPALHPSWLESGLADAYAEIDTNPKDRYWPTFNQVNGTLAAGSE